VGMKNRLWGIPAIALYFYIATVLVGYGYISYFNLPSNFISASLSDNIIFFFQLFEVGKYAIGLISWWVWFIASVGALFIFFLCHFSKPWRVFFGVVGTLLFFTLLWRSYDLGGTTATNTTNFLVPSADCPLASGGRYIIPTILDTQAVLVSIDENNKMTGKFLVRDLTVLPCTLELKNVGRVTK
jgi:hypothetical protein